MKLYQKHIRYDHIESVLATVLNFPFWATRAANMAHEVLWDGNGFSDISNATVDPAWPNKGQFRFTRKVDGKRFKVYMTKKLFKINAA